MKDVLQFGRPSIETDVHPEESLTPPSYGRKIREIFEVYFNLLEPDVMGPERKLGFSAFNNKARMIDVDITCIPTDPSVKEHGKLERYTLRLTRSPLDEKAGFAKIANIPAESISMEFSPDGKNVITDEHITTEIIDTDPLLGELFKFLERGLSIAFQKVNKLREETNRQGSAILKGKLSRILSLEDNPLDTSF